MARYITLVAHRGYSSCAPENTMAAFWLAIQRGFRDIEFDVQLSQDGQPVIVHDVTLDRTTNGAGRVDCMNLVDMQRLDAGSWCKPKYAGERIPTLRQVLTELRGKANLHIEMKQHIPALPAKIAELLAETGWLADAQRQSKLASKRRPRLVVSSEDRSMLLQSIGLLPACVAHEVIIETVNQESLQWASAHGLRSYLPAGNEITAELCRRARALHIQVGAWWWTRQEQNTKSLSGIRYAFVDAPARHLNRSRK